MARLKPRPRVSAWILGTKKDGLRRFRLLTNPIIVGGVCFFRLGSAVTGWIGVEPAVSLELTEKGVEKNLEHGKGRIRSGSAQQQGDLLDVLGSGGQQALLLHLHQSAHPRIAVSVELLGVGVATFHCLFSSFVDALFADPLQRRCRSIVSLLCSQTCRVTTLVWIATFRAPGRAPGRGGIARGRRRGTAGSPRGWWCGRGSVARWDRDRHPAWRHTGTRVCGSSPGGGWAGDSPSPRRYRALRALLSPPRWHIRHRRPPRGCGSRSAPAAGPGGGDTAPSRAPSPGSRRCR